MSALTLRNVDQDLKAAIKETALELGVSQNEAALRALAKGLGKPIRKRRLGGLVEEVFGEDAPKEVAKIDLSEDYSEKDLDAYDAEGIKAESE